MNDRTVLFVDDDQNVLMSLRRGFLDEPYNTLFAGSGKEALEILQQHEVHVIVADLRMPEMSGLELLGIVRTEYPHVVRVILSGQPDIPQPEISGMVRGLNQGDIFKVTAKPWNLEDELKTVIREAVEHYRLNSQRSVAVKKSND